MAAFAAVGPEAIESPRLLGLKVTGFQGSRDFTMKFDQHVNFLIGKNGCGKTTLINLINAGLSGDGQSLLRAQFHDLELLLGFSDQASRYTLKYERRFRENAGAFEIDFKLLGPKGGRIAQRTLRDRDAYALRSIGGLLHYDSFVGSWRSVFEGSSRTPPQVTWLSILRWEAAKSANLESQQQNPIDKRLEELAIRTSRYLSALDSRAATLSATFQKEYFLSLIGYKYPNFFTHIVNETAKLDLDVEESTVAMILSHLKIPASDYRDKLKSQFDHSRKSITEKRDSYTVESLLNIVDTYRLHELNEKWSRLDQERTSIYSPRRIFTDTINQLFINKSLNFSDRNQPIFSLPNKRQMQLSDLSSGEKQIYVILSEALVQEGRTAIYLADEPELSLHVEWQQYLVQNILNINPSCQIIFATHSPDILGPYGRNAINVEGL